MLMVERFGTEQELGSSKFANEIDDKRSLFFTKTH